MRESIFRRKERRRSRKKTIDGLLEVVNPHLLAPQRGNAIPRARRIAPALQIDSFKKIRGF